ncbi:hypothetical protein EJ04DRAFT_515799 [Polyplosphaeria fusca]|uniref:Uncharacterized protein n=1 Tax=Polyplosphaeria fusca TaxID=682080 RepID=A0A9P4QN76_9PLEO|nr:hypothetical protein EJ04DRAFT_515799 [Polyplosphaeria fusca]
MVRCGVLASDSEVKALGKARFTDAVVFLLTAKLPRLFGQAASKHRAICSRRWVFGR